MSTTERTPLRSSEQGTNYVFNTTPHRTYRNRIRKFQCCVCAAVLGVFVVALVITVSWTVNHDPDVVPPTPPGNLTAAAMQRLLKLSWPLPADDDASNWSAEPRGAEVEAAIEVGKAGLRARDLLEESNIPLDVNTPSYRHQKAVGTGEEATKLARVGYIMDLATREIVRGMKKHNQSWPLGRRGPTLHTDWLPEEVCSDEPRFVDMCLKTPFRSADGVCNNPNHPRKWGVAMRPFRRILNPHYADEVSVPRMATDGTSLPSARSVSQMVHRPIYRDDPDFTVMLAVWGQFMDHDVTATALSKGLNGSAISCCDSINTPNKLHPECFTVRLREGDPYYNQYNVSCMEFVRSAPAATCSLGPREQMNQATSYLDGSVVYGSSEQLMRELRTLEGGQLKMTLTSDGRSLLPYNEDPKDGCNQEKQAKQGRYCFASGDSRANENVHLTTMHLLLARQHNQAAKQLSSLNPSWDDERIFQESRRIVAAMMQHITYREFLPVLLGRKLMESMDIFPLTTGYFEGYNVSVDPTVANEFATAAFRFAHTLLPGLIRMIGNDNTSDDYVELHKMLFNPFDLYTPGKMDNTIRGAIATNTERVDPFFTSQVTEKLFQGSRRPVNGGRSPCGLDLVALNIQRGRDHGLPGYPAWRRRCGLTVPKNFEGLKGMIDNDTIHRITTMYRSVNDIDMYTGALSEFPVKGGVLGPTVLCLLADQFFRLKMGDRFWYETVHEPQAFTPEQLHEIRKTTLAGIICANSDNIMSAQPWVMRTKKPGNVPVPCYGSTIHHPDLSLWEEKNGAFVRPGVGRVQVGPLNSIVAIRKKQLSPLKESFGDDAAELKEEIAKWKSGIEKWKDEDSHWNRPASKRNDPLSRNLTSEAQLMDEEDVADADEEMGIWTGDKGYIPVQNKSSFSQLLKASSSNQPQASMTKSVFGRVLTGSVTAMTDGIFPVVWWSGDLPTVIARRPFDSVGNSTDGKDALGDMPVFGQGVYWKATMQNNSGNVQIKGSFSVPKYIHEPRFSVQWWTGAFTFDVVLADTVNETLLLSDISFSSPLYFHKKNDQSPSLLQYQNKTSIQPNFGIHFEVPTRETINSAMKAPVILLGSFLAQSGFLWSGEFILVLSNPGVNLSEDKSSGSNEALLIKPSTPEPVTDPGVEADKVDEIRKVKDEIAKWKDQTKKWKEQDAEWKKIDSKWKNMFSTGSNSTSVVSPLDAEDIANADEEMGLWPDDNAFVPVHNTSSLTQLLKTSYSNQSETSMPKSVFGRVLAGSVTAATEGIFPVVWWNGDLPLVIARRPFDMVSSSTVTKDDMDDKPVFGQGVYWNATIQNDSGKTRLNGSFAIQKYLHEPAFSVQWWTGVFSLEVVFDQSINESFLSPNTLHSSPLYMHKKDDQTPSLLEFPNNANTQPNFSIKYQVPSQESMNSATKAPLILLGSFLGDSSFLWSGEFILALPQPTRSFQEVPATTKVPL